MSKDTDTDMSSEEVDIPVSKTQRKDKKEKKEQKEKKRAKAEAKAQSADPDEASATPAKKRKREALPDEIEIDVAAPEPASKKAARKAKKAKLNPTTTTDKDGNTTDVKAEAKDDKEASAKRSDFGVWIGNLPWSATKDSLRTFLVDNAEMKSEQITRVHLPAPTKPPNPSWTTKPLNRGFAYVDFSSELAMYSAIALTETKMDGRALLIKNAKSFEGRPDKPKNEESQDTTRGAKGAVKGAHPPNKRVFVGNLSFDVTKEDLEAHYSQCGTVEHIHMATFEDSGKCKGYAWITFGDVDAATSAVKGFVWKMESDLKSKKKPTADDNDSDSSSAEDQDPKKAGKKRKWLLNKLFGRDLRCEFAEDSTTRYNKRYGKEKPAEPVDGVNPDRWKNFNKDGGAQRGGGGGGGGGRGGYQKKDTRDFKPRGKVDPRTIKSGAAHTSAPRASQAIVESQGKKTTFE
ncbi:RNA-binding domain-containing protein [Plenodomus tracheiphilus IPT5]|uniref:RNA-binding domain-containing protein n=1 Tax=Plenodomus tracheiphilus IPT5 TaxID=1408161 RepID=A0A6A7B431_9PLEO|nr:RNA-binding domain-containing protein [Plenodomus tracheiphilus IPT5]